MKIETSLDDKGVRVLLAVDISEQAVRFFPELQLSAESASDTGAGPLTVDYGRLLEAARPGLLQAHADILQRLVEQSCDNLHLSVEASKSEAS